MPQLGETITEGTVIRWFKQPGDAVAADEPLCEIETEKVTAELPSPWAGTMGEILVPEGETVEVGTALCTIVTAGAAGTAGAAPAAEKWQGGPMATPAETGGGSPAPVAAPQAAAAGAAAASRPEPPQARPPGDGADRSRFYSPVVLRLAGEHGLDLSTIAGTGVGGRVTRRDVERHLEAATASAPPPEGRRSPPEAGWRAAPLTPTRRSIAAHLLRSNLEAPQAWTMVEVDVSGLVNLRDSRREQFLRDEGVALTLLPFFVHEVCQLLREHPALNARWEGQELRQYSAVHCGIAVAAEHGLVVPVIHDAQDLSASGLARRIDDLASRARARTLRLEDVQGGTFTVNNTGAFGSIASKPLVNHPEVAIVTMERVVRRPIVVGDDAIAIRSVVNVCLSFDHRALDGHEAGAFLAALRSRLEALES